MDDDQVPSVQTRWWLRRLCCDKMWPRRSPGQSLLFQAGKRGSCPSRRLPQPDRRSMRSASSAKTSTRFRYAASPSGRTSNNGWRRRALPGRSTCPRSHPKVAINDRACLPLVSSGVTNRRGEDHGGVRFPRNADPSPILPILLLLLWLRPFRCALRFAHRAQCAAPNIRSYASWYISPSYISPSLSRHPVTDWLIRCGACSIPLCPSCAPSTARDYLSPCSVEPHIDVWLYAGHLPARPCPAPQTKRRTKSSMYDRRRDLALRLF